MSDQSVVEKTPRVPLLQRQEKIREHQAEEHGFQKRGGENENANDHHAGDEAGAAAHEFHAAVVLFERGVFLSLEGFLGNTQLRGHGLQAVLLLLPILVIGKGGDKQRAQEGFLFPGREAAQPGTDGF